MQTMWDTGTNWGYWRMEPNEDGKLTKKPKNPRTGYNADPSDVSTWGASWEAVEANMNDPVDPKMGGLAFMLVDNMAGIDIDAHGVDKNPLQDEILALFDGTYMEKSPSGNGIHILFRVDKSRLPILENGKWDGAHYYQKNPHIDVESYVAGTTKRYLTFTSTMVSESMDMLDMTDQFLTFIEKYQKKSLYKKQAPVVADQPTIELDMSIEQILDKARQASNGADFIALYDHGDLSGHNNDHSAADLALCNYLAWYLGKDAAKIDAAFRNSALYRQKWEREDYRMSTIENAINGTSGQYNPFGGGVGVITQPDTENPSESLSEPQTGDIFDLNVFKWELAQHNIKVRLNCITQEASFVGLPEHIDPTKAVTSILAELYGPLRKKYKGVTTKLMTLFIEAIAADVRNQYNPVLDYFKDKHYDGGEHLARLYRTMGIEDDELSKTLVRKWFMQGWALLYSKFDNPVRGEGVLVLSGPQGCGKTSFFSRMAIKPEFFREGQSISGDKDTKRRAVTAWITELGEIDCTFKSDMGDLKAFITDPIDRYRLPYAATDVVAVRRTNLGGTVNGEKYLIDTTGNRRFWTIPITKRIADELYDETITNPEQIWLEVYEKYVKGKDVNDFRLKPSEQDALNQRNGYCEKPLKFEDEIRDILAEIEADPRHYVKKATVKQFIEAHSVLYRATSQQVSAVFDRLGVAPKVNDGKLTTVDGKKGRYREIPWV